MSIGEILEEIPKLTAEEREEILLKVAELDRGGWDAGADPLTGEKKRALVSELRIGYSVRCIH